MGGAMFMTCYHIGAHKTLPQTYERMLQWAKEHDYKVGEEAWERYVTDYWTTKNEDMFVTEIRLKVSR
jgi:effector-binding domain-containing protein